MSILTRILVALCCVFFTACESTDQGAFPRLLIESRMGNMRDLKTVTIQSDYGDLEIPVSDVPVLTEYDFSRADIAQVDLGKVLALTLSQRGKLRMFQATAGNMGNQLVLTVGGKPVGARRIDGPMQEGVFFIFVALPDSELPALVEDINEALQQL